MKNTDWFAEAFRYAIERWDNLPEYIPTLKKRGAECLLGVVHLGHFYVFGKGPNWKEAKEKAQKMETYIFSEPVQP